MELLPHSLQRFHKLAAKFWAELVAQTAAFAVCGFSPIFLRKPADLKPAGPRYGLEPVREV